MNTERFKVYVDGLDYRGTGTRHGLEHAVDMRTQSTFTVAAGDNIHDAIPRHRAAWAAKERETPESLAL